MVAGLPGAIKLRNCSNIDERGKNMNPQDEKLNRLFKAAQQRRSRAQRGKVCGWKRACWALGGTTVTAENRRIF